MVGIMNLNSRERLASLANSAKAAMELPSKLDRLRQLRHDLQQNAAVFPSDLLPLLFDLLSDRFSAVRKFVTEILGEIGLKHLEYLPEIVPVLIDVLKDATPAVARQAITCGADFFRCTLERVAIQGLHSSELDDFVESSWAWMLKFKDEICSIAFQGSGGVKLLAMKFVAAVILLYTPDPNGSLEAPSHEGNHAEFNISFVRGGCPVLNIGDLSIEASQKLALLLDQLRHPTVKSLSNPTIVVLINSLSTIAKKRPAYYGRILPVLLNLDTPSFVKGVHLAAAHRALKTAFLSCLKCTHPAAAPWRDRLAGALREMEAGGSTEKVLDHVCKTNGSIKDKDNLPASVKEETPVVTTPDAARSNFGRKRSGSQDTDDAAVDNVGGKRARAMPSASEESTKELHGNVGTSEPQVATAPTELINKRGGGDTGPVQQLVAMFGALVAQGEKAIGSLEILISSISADLLADVVMANMHNIPLDGPQDEGGGELVLDMSIVGGDTQVKYPPSFLAGVLSLSNTFPPIASLIDSHLPVPDDVAKSQGEEEVQADNNVGLMFGAENAVLTNDLSTTSDAVLIQKEVGDIVFSKMNEVGNMESGIPGLDSSARPDEITETVVTSSLASTNVEDASQDQIISSDVKPAVDAVSLMSTDRFEDSTSNVATTGLNSFISSTATSVAVASHFVLPKISAPIVDITDEQKDKLQKLVFMRIVEAYKHITISGGLQLRFSLLAHLGVEFPLELDPWKQLQEHILSDYLNHQGHELTVQVLFRLHGEAEEENDFFSSTAAASVYETFLLTVAEALRDSFPPSDKSLSRLLGDAPYLPNSVLKFLESLCCPADHDKAEKDAQSGDRVTQGLSTIWSLILLRPGIRDDCLKIALQSAVHHLEEVRMKAIRLVANKLYPMSAIAQKIEEFARDMLYSVISGGATERADAEGSINESQKDSDRKIPPNEYQSLSGNSKDISSERTQCSSSSLSIPEAQRCMSLYFALCTKKHACFRHIFIVYKSAPDAVKQAIDRHIPILVRTMGSSPELLEIISDPPSGSESLLMQVLHTLTDGAIPSSELILTIRKLFDTKVKDVEILFPILPFLPRDEVMLIFPHLVNLPSEKFQVALSRVLQGSTQSGPVLSPAEVLIAIHGIDPERDRIPLKKVTDACNACFEQRQIFTQQVLAGVLNQLVQQIPLPLLFMRTVLQAIGAFPALVDFIMDILSRLVSKQIWKYPKLWVGFLKCAQLTQPQSFKVLLQLPTPQLENALNRVSALKAPLVAHASQPDICSSLPRSLLVVLGLASDSQAQTNQTQASQSETSQGQTCPMQTIQAQTNQTQVSTSQVLSQAQASESQTSHRQTNQVETSQALTNETQVSNSETSIEVPASQGQTSHGQTCPTQTANAQTSETQVSDSQASSEAHASQAQTSQTQASGSQASSPAQARDTANSEIDTLTETSTS